MSLICSHRSTPREPTISEKSASFQHEKGQPYDTAYMMSNGGYCLSRKGLWSQSIGSTIVHLPATLLIDETSIRESIDINIDKQKLDVRFSSDRVTVMNGERCCLDERLRHSIYSSQSVWTIETHPEHSNHKELMQYIVLYLQKKSPIEWFPGCEWWDSVFDRSDG